MEIENKNGIILRKIIILCIISAVLSVGVAFVITGHLWDIANIRYHIDHMRVWTAFQRTKILFPVFVFLGLHFIFPIKKMYHWIFDKRWILGIALLLFLTANRYHGNSIGYYADVVQENYKTESSSPIFGETRAIRSDEFIVSFPSTLATTYGEDAFSQYNEIMRGTKTLSVMSGIYLGYSTLGSAPQKFAYAIMPVEYAYSFCWWFPIIMGFLMCIELFLIITNRNKLLSTLGAVLIIFSAFYLWWGYAIFYFAAPGTVVCVHNFLQTDKRRKKVLYGIGTAICFSMFVTSLYPAWQVPLGYMFLAIGVWVLHINWDRIKQMKAVDWGILVASVVFMASLILTHLSAISEYTEAVTKTLYPGERIDTGHFYVSKLFYCAQVPFYAYKDIGNPSEMGAVFSLFPIPTIMAAYCWIKEKKKDWLTGGLLLAQMPMLLYITTGLPEKVAKLLLYSSSTVTRASDIVGIMQIFFMIIVLSRYETAKKFSLKIAVPLGILVGGLNIYFSNNDFPGYLGVLKMIVMLLLITVLCIGLMINLKKRMQQILCFTLIAISIFTSVYIRPIMRGFDAVLSKPVAQEIQKICEEDEDAKWLTYGGGVVLSAYNVACGASTVNAVNTYPNMELWEKLDKNSEYEEIYNRYAHITLNLTNEDTSFELVQEDTMRLNLSYQDIEKTEAEYLLTMGIVEIDTDNPYVTFEKIYDEDSVAIYHMIYN